MKPIDLAERSLVGAALMHIDLTDALHIGPEQFGSLRLRGLWEVARAAALEGRRVTMLELERAAPGLVTLEEIGHLGDYVHTTQDVRQAALLIERAHRYRVLAALGRELIEAAKRQDVDPEDIVADTVERATELLDGQACELVAAGDVVASTIADMKLRYEGKRVAMTTGVQSLDAILGGGLEPGGQYVLGARPKHGKSVVAMGLALAAADAGCPVLVLSLEMSELQLGRRLIANQGRVPLWAIRKPRGEDFEGAAYAHDVLRKIPLTIRARRGTLSQLVTAIRQWRRRAKTKRPGLVVMDYLQLAELSRKDANREQVIAEMSRTLKLIAVELDVATLVLSQLNRGLESRDDKRPRPSDLRESGSLEQDADAVMLLYHGHQYDKQSDPERLELNVALQREGQGGGVVTLRFQGQYAQISGGEA